MITSKNILVTGGAGYVGSVLVPQLLKSGYNVKVLDLILYDDHSLDGVSNLPNFELIKGDIRNKNHVSKALLNTDCVIHLASISNDPTAELDEQITKSVNYDAVGQLVKLSKDSGVNRFINASSSSMYGIQSDIPATEETPTKPLSLYAKYKLKSEKFVNGASNSDFTTVNIRPATICGYSPRQRFDLAVNALTYHAYLNNKIIVHGGEQRRPNITIKDISRIYEQLITEDSSKINGQTYNAGFENLKIIEMAKRIQTLFKNMDKDIEIEIQDAHDPRDFLLNSDKIKKELNFEPKYKIEDAVIDIVKAFDQKKIKNPHDDKYFNIKKMKLEDFR